MDIRTELKKLMEDNGYTIIYVATAIGVAKSTISMWLPNLTVMRRSMML